jgi:glycosyltransferase involved in cell wall biosynthesis
MKDDSVRRKKISVVIPTYNEQENVGPMTEAVTKIMTQQLPQYDYEIIYIDNHSKDMTRKELREICAQNPNVKAIFNARNFGQLRSPVHGLKQAYGDCVIRLNADFQDPPELIPRFVREWEKGSKIVIGVKSKTDEGRFMAWVRRQYYRILRKITDIGHIENFTGFGLYDKIMQQSRTNVRRGRPERARTISTASMTWRWSASPPIRKWCCVSRRSSDSGSGRSVF